MPEDAQTPAHASLPPGGLTRASLICAVRDVVGRLEALTRSLAADGASQIEVQVLASRLEPIATLAGELAEQEADRRALAYNSAWEERQRQTTHLENIKQKQAKAGSKNRLRAIVEYFTLREAVSGAKPCPMMHDWMDSPDGAGPKETVCRRCPAVSRRSREAVAC